MRLLLLATGDIFLPALEWLLRQTHLEVALLVSQPDRPVGRKLLLTPPLVVQRAREAGVAVFQPENLRQRRERETVANLGPFDLGIVMAYGQILTPQLLAVPRLGCWNLHASLLPRHRGAAPIQASLLAGDETSGISVIQVVPALDAGPILHEQPLTLRPDHTGGSLHDDLALLAPQALAAALNHLRHNNLEPREQNETQATFIGKLSRADGLLEPQKHPAIHLERQLRAFDPWPGCTLNQPLTPGGDTVTLKLFPPAQIVPTPTGLRANGHLQPAADRSSLLLPCADGQSLEIIQLQLPGKPRVNAADFLRGHPQFGLEP